MHRVGNFEKVSFSQFAKDYGNIFGETEGKKIEQIYENIKLPIRATKGSAGYDIHSPIGFDLRPNQSILIPTGIRIELDEDKFLMIAPRSGLGNKHRMVIKGTLAIIDADYAYADNEGHIMLNIACESRDPYDLIHIEPNDRIAQGIILSYFTTIDDDASGTRRGGFGSTGE